MARGSVFLPTAGPANLLIGDATGAVLVAGHQLPYRLARLDTLHLSRADVPALTVTADPSHGVAVASGGSSDWSLRFCAQAEGETEDEARERLHKIDRRIALRQWRGHLWGK